MQRRKCTSCGYIIFKSGVSDPYVCRDCENKAGEAKYSYLDQI